MKKTFTYFLGGALFALFLLMPSSAKATWTDLKLDFTDGSFLTSSETSVITVGVLSSGARTTADDPSAVATITAKYHSDDHGLSNFSATILNVPAGTYKVSMGTCDWGGEVTIKNGSTTLETFDTDNGTCYHNDKVNNIVSKNIVLAGVATITVSGGNYTPYFAIEEDAYVPNNKTVTFSIGSSGASGVAPDAVTKDINIANTFKIPSNLSLYKANHTLTGWNDGSADYNIGDTYTITDDVTMTPLFTPNETTLSDRAAATTIHWEFTKKGGVPLVGWEGNSGFLVGQAVINGTKIDVKLDIDASSGKFNNSNGDWCQVNSPTYFTMPICKDAEFTTYSMSTTAKGTFDGVSGGTNDEYNLNYTYEGSGSTMVVGLGDATWYKYIEVTYPAQLTRTISIGSAKYATYYNSAAYQLPANLQAATVDENSGGTLTLNYRYGEGDVVPAGTAVLLKATAAGDYTLTMKPDDATATPAGNMLHGSDVATTTTGGDKYYALMYGKGEKSSVLGFYWVNDSGVAFTSPAHKAWLALSDGGANFFSLEDDVTGISGIEKMRDGENEAFFNLAGQRVAQPTKGLYIVNGKKYVVK